MVYQYTKPRGPIAAMYSSPGPCYSLPGLTGQQAHDPRSVHAKGAAYPFGVRHGKFKDDCSPGPMYHPSSKVNRDGQDGTPQYSLYGRQVDIPRFKTPGPGSYCPEKQGLFSYAQPPAYSFGTRHRHRQLDNTPAPNSYTLGNSIGKTVDSRKKQAPIFSITGRRKTGGFSEDLSRTPGPGTYATIDPSQTKRKAPFYSMISRNLLPGDNTTKPGPGAHKPEEVTINKEQRPQFSFGIRHSEYLAPLIVDVQD